MLERGFQVKSTHAKWLNGIGSEHHVLYQISIGKAKRVFLVFQHVKHGRDRVSSGPLPPARCIDSLVLSDQDFYCDKDDAKRYMVYQLIRVFSR